MTSSRGITSRPTLAARTPARAGSPAIPRAAAPTWNPMMVGACPAPKRSGRHDDHGGEDRRGGQPHQDEPGEAQPGGEVEPEQQGADEHPDHAPAGQQRWRDTVGDQAGQHPADRQPAPVGADDESRPPGPRRRAPRRTRCTPTGRPSSRCRCRRGTGRCSARRRAASEGATSPPVHARPWAQGRWAQASRPYRRGEGGAGSAGAMTSAGAMNAPLPVGPLALVGMGAGVRSGATCHWRRVSRKQSPRSS